MIKSLGFDSRRDLKHASLVNDLRCFFFKSFFIELINLSDRESVEPWAYRNSILRPPGHGYIEKFFGRWVRFLQLQR